MQMLELLILFLLQSLTISLVCCGIHFVTRDGWILDFVDDWILRVTGGCVYYRNTEKMVEFNHEWMENIYKPLLGCITCMGSVWGIAGGLIFGVEWYLFPVLIVIVSVLNSIIYFNFLKKHQ